MEYSLRERGTTEVQYVWQPLLIALLSLYAPVVWVGMGFRMGGSEFGEMLFDPRFRYGLVDLWLPAIWAGTIPLTVPLWFLYRRVGGWAFPAGTVSVLLSVGVIFLSMVAVFGIGCFGCSEPSPYQIRNGSFGWGVLVAACSLPAWINLTIVALYQRQRARRR